ncbi:hypothetical protein ACQV5M_21025, partial [Leptospira sp. SA-E8]|uniref:hypothetical protein n=1 Tax=Leptospira sp. SA-E8 TaxID=3422259 RepID=UPI003EB8AED5
MTFVIFCYDAPLLNIPPPIMPLGPSRKQLTHDRIVDAAARALRGTGFAGVGVADIMKQSGL